MPKAYAYIRVSTAAQTKGDGRHRQREAAVKFAADNNLELVTESEFDDSAISAYRGDNVSGGALGRFLMEAEDGRIEKGSYLLTESFDRMSRQNAEKALSTFIRIKNLGINVVTLADGQLFKAGEPNDMQLIMSILMMSRAHEESAIKSHRLNAVWARKRQVAHDRIVTPISPGWLKPAKNRREFDVIEERANVVRRIYLEAAAGIGSCAIARRLNEEGIRPFGRSDRWGTSSVSKVLQNRSVLGEYQPHRKITGKRVPEGEAIEGYFPKIVDLDLYLRAQHGRHARAKSGSGRKGEGLANLFTGLAKCAYCGASMRFITKGQSARSGKPHLRCSGSLQGPFCVSKGWPYERFETSFLNFVSEIDLASIFSSSDHAGKLRSLNERVTAHREQLRRAELKREQTYLLIEQEGVDVKFVAKKLGECECKIGQIKLELSALNRQALDHRTVTPLDLNDVRALIDRLNGLPSHERYLHRTRLASRLKDVVGRLSLRVLGDQPYGLPTLQPFDAFAKAYVHLEPRQWLSDHRFDVTDAFDHPSFSVTFKDGTEREVIVDRQNATKLLASTDLTIDDEIVKLQWRDQILHRPTIPPSH